MVLGGVNDRRHGGLCLDRAVGRGCACGLPDIYTFGGGVVIPQNMLVSVTGCPYDYGLYPNDLSQSNVVSRLLMNGHIDDTAMTISRGAVLGVGTNSVKIS